MAAIYIVTSSFWWVSFRTFKSLYVLVAPFAIYGLAFFILGLANHTRTVEIREWAQNIATALYAAASSSYGFYFSLNFANNRSSSLSQSQKIFTLISFQAMYQ